jgi:hypothetical protein
MVAHEKLLEVRVTTRVAPAGEPVKTDVTDP